VTKVNPVNVRRIKKRSSFDYWILVPESSRNFCSCANVYFISSWSLL